MSRVQVFGFFFNSNMSLLVTNSILILFSIKNQSINQSTSTLEAYNHHLIMWILGVRNSNNVQGGGLSTPWMWGWGPQPRLTVGGDGWRQKRGSSGGLFIHLSGAWKTQAQSCGSGHPGLSPAGFSCLTTARWLCGGHPAAPHSR